MKKIILIYFCLFISLMANEFKIKGKIKDHETGKGIPGVNIMIKGTKKGTVSDENGKYVLKIKNPGNFRIVFLHLGYEEKIRNLEVFGNKEIKLNIKLVPRELEMEETIVNSKSEVKEIKKQPMAVSVLTGREFKGRALSVNQVLAKSTGIKVRVSGGLGSSTRLSLHGLEGKRVGIFINDFAFNSADGSLTVDDIPIDLIDRIEIYKGLVPAKLGGDGLGGAVNIQTLDYETDLVGFSFENSSYNTNRLSYGAQKYFEKVGVRVRFGGFYNYSDNDYSVKIPNRKTEIKRNHDTYESYIIVPSLIFTKCWFDVIELEPSFYHNYKELQGLTNDVRHAKVESDFYLLNVKMEKEDAWFKGLDWISTNVFQWSNFELIDTSTYQWTFSGERFVSPYGKGEVGEYPNYSDDELYQMKNRQNVNYAFNDRQSLNFNLQTGYSHEKNKDTLASRWVGFDISGYPNKLMTAVGGLTYEGKHFSETIHFSSAVKAFYLNSKVYETTQASLIGVPGSNEEDEMYWGCAEGVTYRWNEFLRLKASYEYATRMPSTTELFGDGVFIGPSYMLKPERSHNFNLGFIYDQMDCLDMYRLQMEGNAFLLFTEDMIKLKSGVDRAAYTNTGEVEIKGVEFDIKADVTKNLFFYANLTYQDLKDKMKYLKGTNNVKNPTYDKRVPNVPYFYGNFGFELHGESFFKDELYKIFVDYSYTDEFLYNWEMTDTQRRRVPSTNVVDLGIQHSLLKNDMVICFEIRNLFDKEIYDNFKMQKPGRVLLFKIRYNLFKDKSESGGAMEIHY